MNVQFATGAPRLLSPARASAIAVAVAVTAGQVHAQNLQPVALNSDSTAVNAAAGAIPPSTYNWSSRSRLAPGTTDGVPASVPAATRPPICA